MISIRKVAICFFICCSLDVQAVDTGTANGETVVSPKAFATANPMSTPDQEVPWDYAPYRVLIWLSSDDPLISADAVRNRLLAYLDRDFAAVWRTEVATTPTAIGTIAARDIGALDYNAITGADPVLAIKRDHKDAVRIRTVGNVGEYCESILATQSRIDDVLVRAEELGDASCDGVAKRLTKIGGDESAVARQWANEQTEGLLVARGIANTLVEPEAKLIAPSVSGLVGQTIESYDKIFIVHVRREQILGSIEAVEVDTLMRHFGPPVSVPFSSTEMIPVAIGQAVRHAFAPVVRIENAGQRSASGLLRARGLILDETSPAIVSLGDALEPMVRKNDRNGEPVVIGPMEWAVLLATEQKDRFLKMDFYAGRSGGLQGRKNNRTFRMALKARPRADSTTLRLHLQRNDDFPLIGYELYEKELNSKKMTFVGRTDWDGRLRIEKSEHPLRLLYVKNGGAVLARLPIVPGLQSNAVADLSGDDMRLQAEAYIRGVQNDITDLVAMRELYKARIRLQLEKGEIDKAEELMIGLRSQPNNEELSGAIGRKQIEFLAAIGKRNVGQRRKVDEMFTTTRELLSKYVTPKLIREVEADLIAARENVGRLPGDEESVPNQEGVDEEAVDEADQAEALAEPTAAQLESPGQTG